MGEDALVALITVTLVGHGYGPQQAARRAFRDAPKLVEAIREARAELDAEAAAAAAKARSTAEAEKLRREAEEENLRKIEAALRDA